MIRTILNAIKRRKYTIKSIYLFTNGKALVFDDKGDQISRLQGMAIDDDGIDKIMQHANKDTKVYKNLDYSKYFSNSCVRDAYWVLNKKHDRK